MANKNKLGAFNPMDILSGAGGMLIKNLIKKAQKENKKNPDVKTAPKSLFDNLKGKINQTKIKKGDSEEVVIEKIKKQIDQARKENKKNPNEATADKALFVRLKELLDENKSKISSNVRPTKKGKNIPKPKPNLSNDFFDGLDDEFAEFEDLAPSKGNERVRLLKREIKKVKNRLEKRIQRFRKEAREEIQQLQAQIRKEQKKR